MKHQMRGAALLRAATFAVALTLGACGGGGGGGGGSAPAAPAAPPPATPTNRAPVAQNDVLQVTGAGLASVNVLANDSDPDNDALTVTITAQPFVGTAAVNTNNTVRIDGLPSGFRGVTRFSYQVRDPSGATATANAAVFVDTKPFKLVFAADETKAGAGDLYVTDLAANPVKIATVVQGALKNVSFRTSKTGNTVAYVRADPANVAGTQEIYYVRTAPLGTPVRVTLPGGATLFRSGGPQYAVSPDGRYVVIVGGTSATQQSVHVLDVTSGSGTPTAVPVADAPVASSLQFSADSQFVYWLGRASATDVRGTLWRMPLDRSSAPVRISAAGTNADGIVNFTSLQTRSLVIAGREASSGANAIVAIDPATPGSERVLNHAPTGGEQIDPRGITLSPNEQRFTYGAALNGATSTWLANVAGTPAPRLLIDRATGTSIPAAIRPDNAALLYVRTQTVNNQTNLRYFETPLDGAFAETAATTALAPFVPVTAGVFAGYDGTNDRIVFERGLEVQGELANEVATIARAQFGGAPLPLGTSGQVSPLRNFSAIDRGVVVLGQRAPAVSGQLNPALVNVAAPDKPYAFTPGVFIGVEGLDVVLVEP